ncbi:glutathione S-transferase [Bosea sp. Root381]|uniref:glutathione S-transferase family protein n=1 Tax=Bosea sp. Root381 TaxID=1736524 RepID=UPI0006FBAD72|nr:glutathione S-transferase family protein [Bosea sp. Root381]KRE05892.1 glutathione S-transferase [Bosea sp. Root381]
MITLYGFGPAFGLPDPSPFCLKADILLQLSGLPFQRKAGNLRRAPKRKLPLIVDDGVTVADSSFIRFHLESRHGIDFDRGLDDERRGALWALEKMLEEQLYWIVVDERWLDDANFARGPAHFFKAVPAPLRPLVGAMVRRHVRRNMHAHGIGRHSRAEMLILAGRALDAASGILGTRTYLGGDEPAGGDAALGAFMIAGLCPLFASPLRGEIEKRPALVAYAARMRERFFPEAGAVRSAA